jgi:hypothetical protein
MASDAMSSGFVLYLTLSETSTNPAANTSVVSYSLYINPPGNYESYNLNSGSQSYSVTINGSVVGSGGFTYDFRSPNNNTNKVIKSGTVTITHNADGSKVVAASGFANTSSSTVGDGSISSFNTTLTDFSRVPAAPAAPTLALSSTNPMVIDITSAVSAALSPVGPDITDYEYQISTDNTTWGAAVSLGTDRVGSYTSTTPGLYYVQTRALSSEGAGAWSASASITTFSGGKVWNGTAFVPGTAKVWNGTGWSTAIVKVWGGSSWTNAK